jgi:hypothetical protein
MKKTQLKFVILLGAALLTTPVVQAQSIAPQSVNSSSTSMSQGNGSISFTVGELVILNNTDSEGNSLGSGFTNGATVSTTVLSVTEPRSDILKVKLYPNPAGDMVFVDVLQTRLEHLYICFSDLQGKLVYSEKYAGMANKIGINTASFASGTYILSLRDSNNNTLGTYKLIKQ